MRRLAVVGLLLALGLAGCLDEGPPVTARGIEEAPVEAGDGPFTFRIAVSHGPGGERVAGAGVVVYSPAFEAPVVDVDTSGNSASIDFSFTTPTFETILRLKTDENGVAVARVDAGTTVGIVVAADDYTEEWMANVPTGEAGDETSLEIPVYLEHVQVSLNATWSGPGQLGFPGSTWDAQEIQFHPDPTTDQGYRNRLAALQVQVNWENGLEGAGDLSAAAGPNSDSETARSDEELDIAAGARSETLSLDQSGVSEAELVGAMSLHAGPATDSGFLAPNGLDYQLTVDANFRGLADGFDVVFQ